MPKSKKLLSLISIAALVTPLVSCENPDPVKIVDGENSEITLNVSLSSTTFKYDGKNHSLSIVGELPDNVYVSYIGNNQSEVGEHSVVANFTNSLDSSKKYKSLSATMYIVDDLDSNLSNKLANVVFPDQTVTYTGLPVTLAVSNLPSGYSVTYSKNDDGRGYIDVGTYVVYATISDQTGTKIFNKSAILTILPKSTILQNVRFNSKTYIYNGTIRSLEIEGNLPSYLTVQYSNNNQVDAGIYTVTATFISSDPNIKAPSPMYATLRIVDELSHTITFVDENGNVLSTIPNVIDGTSLSEESVPNLLPDYPNAYEKHYDESLISNIRDDVTVTVTYTLKKFKLTYIVPHGTKNEKNPSTYTYDDFITLEEPNIDKGYYFVGYYADSAYTIPLNSISLHSVGDKTIYSKVEEIPDSGVIFKNAYKIYDGNPAEVAPQGNVLLTDKYTISYYDTLGNKLNSAPINAGVYSMVMEYSRLSTINTQRYDRLKDFTATLIIDKAAPSNTLSVVANEGVTLENGKYMREYSETDGVKLSIANLPNYLHYTVSYYSTNNVLLSSYPQNAGNYYARISFTADDNHTAPADLIENIYIKKQVIKLTDAEKKAIFKDTTYKYEKGTTYTLTADLSKLPEKYQSLVTVERYVDNQSASIVTKTARVYLSVVGDNYYLDDSCLYIDATLKVENNADLRTIKYIYKGKEITYRDTSLNKQIDTTVQVNKGNVAPELTITESMFSNTLTIADGANFLGKDGFKYGWTNLKWTLSRNINGTAYIPNNIIPNDNTTYYMILTATDMTISVKYASSNIATSKPTDTTLSKNQKLKLSNYTTRPGYEFVYLYTDPRNPQGSQITELDANNYLASQTSSITIYPMFRASDTTNCNKVYLKYKDTDGTIKNYTFVDNAAYFNVPFGGEIPLFADIEAAGFTFSGWYVQTSSTGTDISTPSKKLTNNYKSNTTSATNYYIYGELIAENYDIVVNFPGEESYTIKVKYKGKIATSDITALNNKVTAYLKKHPEYDSTFKVAYKDTFGSVVDITKNDYVYSNTSDMVLEATFEKITYYTRFAGVDGLDVYNNLNGGKGLIQREDSTFVLPTTKILTGYTFKNWILSAAKGNFTPIEVNSSTIVNLANIYNEATHGQLTLTAVYESNEYLAIFISDDGVTAPSTRKFAYKSSNFFLNSKTSTAEAETQILTTNADGSTAIAFTAPTKKGYTFLGFYVGEYKLSNVLANLNKYIDENTSLSQAEKEKQRKLFKFDSNTVITCRYEKITYQMRFYDNRNNVIDLDKVGGNDDTYIKELDNYYVVGYNDLFALPSNLSYKGMEGYKVEGYYLEFSNDSTLDPTKRVSNRIIDITRCIDSGNFKPSEAVTNNTTRPIINVYINLVPQTYHITLIEENYTAKDDLHDGITRNYKTKTVEVTYGQNLKDVVVETYTVSDGKGGYITKEIKLIDELPIKDGYEFDGWILSTSYDKDTGKYKKNLIFNYQRDENGKYVLDENGNKIRVTKTADDKEVTYDYNYNISIYANYVGKTLQVNYKYEVENAAMVNNRYTGLTLTGDISTQDIIDSIKSETADSKFVTGLPSTFDGTLIYSDLAISNTILDNWIKNYVQTKNQNNHVLDNAYVASWYYVRYDDYNETTGQYDTQTRVAITASTVIRSTDKIDLVCVFTSPTSPVTFFDEITKTNLTKPSTIHSNVPLMLKMAPEYRRDSNGNLTSEIANYNYQLIELVDTSTDADSEPNYSESLGNIRATFSIPATTSSSSYTFDGLSFNITYGNAQPEGTPSSITLGKVYNDSNETIYQFIFAPSYEIDDNGNKTKMNNNYISNPGSVVFTPVYVPRNNVRVAFYSDIDMNSNTLFATQYISSGGTYTIPTSTPKGKDGQVFVGWVLRGGDTSSLVKSGTFTASPTATNIIYYAKYEYTNIRISYRVGSEIVMVKQTLDGASSASQIYDKDTISKTRIVIGGYEFNGNTSYLYNPTTGIGNPTTAGCVYNHYKITKWKVVDEDGNLVYTNQPYITSGSTMLLSGILNTSATNVYFEPYEDGGMTYVGVSVSYLVNNVSYGPFVVDENVEFSPLEVLKDSSLLYQHGLRTVYTSYSNTTLTHFSSDQKVAISFRNQQNKPNSIILNGVYAYDVTNDGMFTFNADNEISAFNINDSTPAAKKEIWQSVILPGYYFTTNKANNTIESFSIVKGIADSASSSESIFGKVSSKTVSAGGNPVGYVIKAVSFPTETDNELNERSYTKIGNYAFYGCNYLKTLTLSANTVTIGDFAFANCSSLQAVECPSQLENINRGAFLDTNNLKTITFNKKLKTIEEGAFMLTSSGAVNYDKLTTLKFPLSLQKIGNLAFTHRGSLTNISWEDVNHDTKNYGSNISIGDYAFAIVIDTNVYVNGKNGNHNIYFEKVSATNMKADSEYDDTNDLDSSDVLSRASTMYALYQQMASASSSTKTGPVTLEYEAPLSITFPRNLTYIGTGAFKYRTNFFKENGNCVEYSLKFYDFKTDLQLGRLTAKDIKALPALTIANNAFRVKEDTVNSADLKARGFAIKILNGTGKSLKFTASSSSGTTLPINITTIGSYAFAYRRLSIEVETEKSSFITDPNHFNFINDATLSKSNDKKLTIGDCAFISARNIYYFNAINRNTIETYYTSRQSYNNQVVEINLPTNLNEIGNYAFFNNYVIPSFYQPESSTISKIGSYTFALDYSHYPLAWDSITGNDIKCSVAAYPYNYNYDDSKYDEDIVDGDDSSYNPREGVFDFANIDDKSKIDAKKLYDMSNSAYYFPYVNDQTLHIPSSLVTIGDSAFLFNHTFNTISFLDDASAGDDTNRQLKYLGAHAFDGNYALKTIKGDLTNASVDKNADTFTLGKYAFRNCYSLEGNGNENVITIPLIADNIPEGLFANCVNLKNVNLQSNAEHHKTIGAYAFYNCKSLETVDNNDNNISFTFVTKIGARAFEECRSLSKIIFDGNVLGSDIDEQYLSDNSKTRILTTMEFPYIGANRNDSGAVSNTYNNQTLTYYSFAYKNTGSATTYDATFNLMDDWTNKDTTETKKFYNMFEQADKHWSAYSKHKKFMMFNTNQNLASNLNYADSLMTSILLINYEFVYSPLGARAFYINNNKTEKIYKLNANRAESDVSISPCTISFKNRANNVTAISPYALARNGTTSFSLDGGDASLQRIFPYLFNNDDNYSGGINQQVDVNSDDYIQLGYENGQQGIIGSYAFSVTRSWLTGNDTILKLGDINNSNFSYYLRSKYILPFGLADISAGSSYIYLNRVGDYNTWIDSIYTVMDANASKYPHSEQIPETNKEMQERTSPDLISTYFDLNYVVTPFMFAGCYLNSSSTSHIYLDGQINEFGFALMQGVNQNSTLYIITASTETQNFYLDAAPGKYEHSFNHDTAKPIKTLNYIDITQGGGDNKKRDTTTDYGFLGWGQGYKRGGIVSLGVQGFLPVKAAFAGYNASGKIYLYTSVFCERKTSSPVNTSVDIQYGVNIGARDFYEHGTKASVSALISNACRNNYTNFYRSSRSDIGSPLTYFSVNNSKLSLDTSTKGLGMLYTIQNNSDIYNSSDISLIPFTPGSDSYYTVGNVFTSSGESYAAYSTSLATIGIFSLGAAVSSFMKTHAAGFITSTTAGNGKGQSGSTEKTFKVYNHLSKLQIAKGDGYDCEFYLGNANR